MSGLPPTVVGPDQVDAAVAILVDAFHDDPLWGWACPDAQRRREQHDVMWRAAVEGASRYPWTWLAAGATAAAVWIPPGGTELTAEEESAFEARLTDVMGTGAERVLSALAALDRARPADVPYFYLSLLGTAPAHRGKGHGLGLLAENLARIDALGAPAYLEASNLANVPLYARYGFAPVRTLRIDSGPQVTTMWREPVAR